MAVGCNMAHLAASAIWVKIICNLNALGLWRTQPAELRGLHLTQVNLFATKGGCAGVAKGPSGAGVVAGSGIGPANGLAAVIARAAAFIV